MDRNDNKHTFMYFPREFASSGICDDYCSRNSEKWNAAVI